jgi:hypothetical protein
MELQVSPEPSDEERAAIAAALAEEVSEGPSPWAATVLPDRKESEKP